jgi:FkbM family methyltransferase
MLFDIGANRGLYTLANLSKYEKIILIDANPELCQQLRKIFASQPKCVIEHLLVSKDSGVPFYFCQADTLSTASLFWVNSSRFTQTHSWQRVDNLLTAGIDQLVEKHGIPSYIKIDVEGYEKNVIMSMTRRYCPIAFEWAEESLEEILETIGYLDGIGFQEFAVQQKDDYDYLPPTEAYTTCGDIIALLRKECNRARKELWGMIHCK